MISLRAHVGQTWISEISLFSALLVVCGSRCQSQSNWIFRQASVCQVLFKIIPHKIARANRNVRNQGKVATPLSEAIAKSVSGGVPDGLLGHVLWEGLHGWNSGLVKTCQQVCCFNNATDKQCQNYTVKEASQNTEHWRDYSYVSDNLESPASTLQQISNISPDGKSFRFKATAVTLLDN